MPSEKLLQPIDSATALCFGDISRDEINHVLVEAGISLFPPGKTPFATGIKVRRRRRKAKRKGDEDNLVSRPMAPASSSKPSSVAANANASSVATLVSPAVTTSPTPPLSPIEKPNGNTTAAVPAVVAPVSAPAPAPSPAPAPAPTPAPIKSWAALVKSPDKTKPPSTPMATAQTPKPAPPAVARPAVAPTKKFTGIADIINQYEPSYAMPLLQPRGLINTVNTCFMNVILQPLSHCPPFYSLVHNIGQHVVHSFKSQTPLLDSLIEFINEYRPQPTDDEYGEPFVPEYVYDALRGQKRFDSLRGRQEDAEEFLCFLLDGLHEEMVAVLKQQAEKREEEERKNSQWMEVGPKNKTTSIRTSTFEDSPIKKIFGGTTRSVLRCAGAKDSVIVEPYQSLPLDIQPDSVMSIEDAIHNMIQPEIMHDYMSPKGVRVDATKQVYLEHLPPILILHMKRFVFDNVGGVQKLRKQVAYGTRLTIQPEWTSVRSASTVQYQLFGVVYHHGSSAGGGHYTCDIKRQTGEWLHIDDTTIVPVDAKDVVTEQQHTPSSATDAAQDRSPYVLFFMKV
ncbi:hypothetical protein BC940DRAFT_257458 [Gongronella butleri]|nr:hypothetical protein BC940DRAFT_257458 [Gongronella butleri]